MTRLTQLIPLPGEVTNWAILERNYHDWVQTMHQTTQDPFNHSEGNVWTHTKMVVDALTQHSWWADLDPIGRRITWLAALLHDIGKPATTVIAPTGRVTSKGHAVRGAQDARIWLWQEDLPCEEREQIARLIALHQVPFHTLKKEDYAYAMNMWSHQTRLDWLSTIALADALGRTTQPTHAREESIESIELFRLIVEEQELWGRSAPCSDTYTWQKYLNSPSSVDPNYHIRPSREQVDVWLLSGLPGSGKDYWCQHHKPDVPMLSYDEQRKNMDVVHGEKTGEVVHAVWDKAKEYLRRRQPFVWNATHLSHTLRKKTLDLLWNYDARIHLVYLEANSMDQWKSQNENRLNSVPDKVLNSMLYRWEPPFWDEAEDVQVWIGGVNKTQTFRNKLNIGQIEKKLVHSSTCTYDTGL